MMIPLSADMPIGGGPPVFGGTLRHRAYMPTKLPPLILHPFSDASAPDIIVEGSRAAMRLGMTPVDGQTRASLEALVLNARYCEFRMMFYLGKDVERWIEQCLETVDAEQGWTDMSFASLLIEAVPERVRAKLSAWGVEDYRTIFTRALGIRAIFHELPDAAALAPRFLQCYCQFADAAFACRQKCDVFRHAETDEFNFELYASAEYTRMLEVEWRGTL